MKIYLISSLRNPQVPRVAEALRAAGFDVFDDWFAAGDKADDAWQSYETARGTPYDKALKGYAAHHVFRFDHEHLMAADVGVLLMPAGKSAHLELGWMLGLGKRGYVLFPDRWPERWDVMYQFTNGVFLNERTLIAELAKSPEEKP